MALGVALIAVLLDALAGGDCGSGAPQAGGAIALGPPGSGAVAGATEYGGPGDPSSGEVGASGQNLIQHPDSYAELGGLTFQTATMMGGLAYMTPLRITWGDHSAIAYKRDFGLGGGPIDGVPRAIDLWWQFAGALRIPYDDGQWSGTVQLERPPDTGSAALLGEAPAPGAAAGPGSAAAAPGEGAASPGDPGASLTGDPAASPGDPACTGAGLGAVALTSGARASLLPDGLAAAPAGAPLAVKEIIAAGNQIAGKPYVYGAAHGLPLSEIAPAYDCSSSVEHLLYGAGLIPVTDTVASGDLESFGAPGPGRWVTLYASPDHVFMYVAGLRWDTHNAAGAGDGSTGIGWHPLIRDAGGFVARHPVGL